MYKKETSFYKRESDYKTSEIGDTSKSADMAMRRFRKADQFKEEAMKGEETNAYKLRQAITTIDAYKDNKHPNITKKAQKLSRCLKDIFDYRLQWLKEEGNKHLIMEEFQLQDRGLPLEEFHPLPYSSQITRSEALKSFDNAQQYLKELWERDVNVKSILLSEALRRIAPFFDKTKEKIESMVLTPSPETSPEDTDGEARNRAGIENEHFFIPSLDNYFATSIPAREDPERQGSSDPNSMIKDVVISTEGKSKGQLLPNTSETDLSRSFPNQMEGQQLRSTFLQQKDQILLELKDVSPVIPMSNDSREESTTVDNNVRNVESFQNAGFRHFIYIENTDRKRIIEKLRTTSEDTLHRFAKKVFYINKMSKAFIANDRHNRLHRIFDKYRPLVESSINRYLNGDPQRPSQSFNAGYIIKPVSQLSDELGDELKLIGLDRIPLDEY